MNRIHRFAPHTAKGLSLIELMISIALVAIILAGVVKLYADSHRSSLANEGVARTQEGIRYVLDHIGRSAARAGYMGCMAFEPPDANDLLATSNIENLINTSTQTGRLYDFDTGPVFGSDNDGANGSDTLILRSARASEGVRVSSIQPVVVHPDDRAEFASSGLQRGDVVVLSDCKKIRVFMMTNDASGSGAVQHAIATVDGVSNTRNTFENYDPSDENQGSLISLFPATESSIEYSIGDSTAGACSAATPEFCALLANGQELLQGVEDMQVLFGERIGSSLRYRTAGEAGIDWQNIVSVELTLTLNSVDSSFTSEADGLSRKTVTHVVALRNGDL